MPIAPTYPGVYVEEIPSGVHTIVGVATSNTAFVGRTLRGPDDRPYVINSFGDFQRTFGGLWTNSPMSFAVRDFYLNGGSTAIIVRVARNAKPATIDLVAFKLQAKYVGAWGNRLRVRVDISTRPPVNPKAFNLTISLRKPTDPNNPTAANDKTLPDIGEQFVNLSIDPASTQYLGKILPQSNLITFVGTTPAALPAANSKPQNAGDPLSGLDSDAGATGPFYNSSAQDGTDGDWIKDTDLLGDPGSKTGIYRLLMLQEEIFNLLCLPPPDLDSSTNPSPQTEVGDSTVLQPAAQFCAEHRAMLMVNPPKAWTSIDAAVSGATSFMNINEATNAAVYFPRLKEQNPLSSQVESFVPCGAMAGIYARTDATRGVWKAPAGIDATLTGVLSLPVGDAGPMNDDENGQLNPLGINCLRAFPIYGRLSWGARTLRGADQLASEWKYVPVRRTALYIEESLFRGLKWVVFEPNDEPLWAQIRLNVGSFMQDLFRQGAFQGRTPAEAYLVKCDGETTTQDDIDRGVVNILVGFAPLKPAEFVVLQIQQLAGQSQT